MSRPANQKYGGAGTTVKAKKTKTKKPSATSAISPSDVQTAGADALANLDPTKPLTMGQLTAAMNSAKSAKYGSSVDAANQAISQQGQQAAQIPGYYQQYRDTLAANQASQQQAYTNASQAASVDGQGGALGALGNLFAGSLAARGQNAYDNSQSQINLVPQMQQGAQLAGQAQHNTLVNTLNQTNQEAGDYGNQWLVDAIEKERANEINQQTLTAAGYKDASNASSDDAKFEAQYGISPEDAADGIDPTEAKTIAAYQKTIHPKTPKTPATHNPIDGIDYDEYQKMSPAARLRAHRDYVKSGHIGNQSGVSPEKARSNQNAFDSTLADARTYNNATGKAHTEAEYDTYFGAGSTKQHPADLQKIVTYWAANGGHVTQAMIDQLHKLGIKIGSGHLQTNPNVEANYPGQG